MEDVLGKIRERLYDKILKFDQKSERRIYLDISPEDIYETARFLFKDLSLRFATASGIDTPQGLEILYHFSHDPGGEMISLRVFIPAKLDPHIQSLAPLFAAAEWIEREMWELLGIHFDGHPNLKHLLLIDDWPQEQHPLRHKK